MRLSHRGSPIVDRPRSGPPQRRASPDGVRPVVVTSVALALLLPATVEGQETGDLLLDPEHPAWDTPAPPDFRARFETSEGDFVVEVRREWAPRGADRFYNLVRHGFFDDTRVFRVVEGSWAQFGVSGDPAVTRAWAGRTLEDDPVVASNVEGAVAYAMTGPDTRLTQVYVNLADNTRLDADGFAPFGRVVEGMDVVHDLWAGYGEEAVGGMRAGRQGPMLEGGNRWLDERFPRMSRILRAEVVSSGGG